MFILSEDIEIKLQKKYPDIHIKSIIDDIFREIIEKTIKDGSTVIKGFGKFVSYASYSGKLDTDVIRFKFKASNAFMGKIKKDEYLLNNAIKPAKRFIGNKLTDRTGEIRKENLENMKTSLTSGNEKTKEKLALYQIESLLEDVE